MAAWAAGTAREEGMLQVARAAGMGVEAEREGAGSPRAKAWARVRALWGAGLLLLLGWVAVAPVL